MATKIIAASAATPNNPPPRPAAQIHEHALDILNELRAEQDKAFSIAFAGTQCSTGDDENIQRNIFAVMEDMLSDETLIGTLRRLIDDLARAAGSNYVEGANHA